MRQAGYTDERIRCSNYKTSTDPVRVRIATVIQQQLAEVGIDMRLSSYDWGTFFGDIKAGRFQMYSLAWVGIKTPDIFRYAFHSSSLPPEGANRGRLASAAVDRLIEAAEQGATLEAQGAILPAGTGAPAGTTARTFRSGTRIMSWRHGRDHQRLPARHATATTTACCRCEAVQ